MLFIVKSYFYEFQINRSHLTSVAVQFHLFEKNGHQVQKGSSNQTNSQIG